MEVEVFQCLLALYDFPGRSHRMTLLHEATNLLLFGRSCASFAAPSSASFFSQLSSCVCHGHFS